MATVQMAVAPVTPKRIELAKAEGLWNVDNAAVVSRRVGLPFWAACGLLEKETGGREVWGGADASPYVELNKLDLPITKASFWAYYIGVLNGLTPTGVNVTQITYAGKLQTRPDGTKFRDGGFYKEMLDRGLRPWVVEDCMLFGFEKLWNYYLKNGHSWRNAGRIWNGSESYGIEFLALCEWWKDYLKVPGSINP